MEVPFWEESSPHAVEVAHRQVVIRELSCTPKKREKKRGVLLLLDGVC